MDFITHYVSPIATLASLAVSLVTLYQLRLFIGKEIAKGVRKLDL
jgi:hypothetical protein